jgi:hypothetical protein
MKRDTQQARLGKALLASSFAIKQSTPQPRTFGKNGFKWAKAVVTKSLQFNS